MSDNPIPNGPKLSNEDARKRRKNSLVREHGVKDDMVFQQAVLIGLANKFCGFTIENPSKMSQITATLPNISKIHTQDDLIDVSTLAEKQANDLLNKSKHFLVKEKSLQRRIKKNIIYFTQNLLIDFCSEHGFFFNSIYSKKNPKTFQVERVQQIFYKNNFLMKKDEIQSVGTCINNYLLNISHGKTFFLRQNDVEVQNLLAQNITLYSFVCNH
ncbi:hypothetical protein EHI8A_124570 [Entamoeba histolytica HM-1:IMSS-B]|uniref:Uncharacterized protein n=6 Tax=Entamoeba histolytica TaxID=5759 RepID=C4MB55_ENTH1|nr:hypothetical protein EHI_102030 [Entamoeba histolytica HM-1:IMSS]EMD43497.1 Hypothetical protein EHI5A_070940 [Entamoeba histolytica KU27]EMH75419.1 hypothetical protein EHI8A_124570 [Entamoeba histolytica HM-1:IMSS-B]EMS16418.1 hypothetical protein KM1_115400 [Entamoeba histolytica HM-3:IMSS]ENY65870.1 hypothetical protein EHI7A_068000 [Entamoeba histolytica HM-1:IMSS-A]GAT99153.1 hypothetical protein CL6EHI_102030 [Entamoeba histolytica]|eukprot:XP_648357.1 hypothetical protein EHI_102030 [Entamoeba histolytica HM-1:IMSS]